MKHTEMEAFVFKSYDKFEEELQVQLKQMVKDKLLEYKKKNNIKETVKLISGNGTWVFKVGDVFIDEIHEKQHEILKELDESFLLFAGERNLYILGDIEV